jgi:hypothetical protein
VTVLRSDTVASNIASNLDAAAEENVRYHHTWDYEQSVSMATMSEKGKYTWIGDLHVLLSLSRRDLRTTYEFPH